MLAKVATFIKHKPLTVAFATLGLGLALALFVQQGREIKKIQNRIVKVESRTPCFKLTARQCALKLYASLPDSIRNRSIRIIRSELRELLIQQGTDPSVVPEVVPGPNGPPGNTGPTGRTGPPGSQGPPGQTIRPTVPQPDNPLKPGEVVVDPKPFLPTDTIDIPGIELASPVCVELPILIKCEE